MNEPRTLTEAIARITTQLATLDWTDAIYGRAALHDIKLAGQDKPQLKPEVFDGIGGYIDARPNDRHKSVVFFAAPNPERNDYNQAAPFGHAPNHIPRPVRPLILYGWVNLRKLPKYDDGSGFAELIKLDLKRALKRVRCITAFGNFQDGQLNEVFKPFQITDLDTTFDRWPFACFRFELTVMTIETRATDAY